MLFRSDIGIELSLEGVGSLTDPAYLRRYEEKLELCDATYPMSPDQRLWKGR